jgi:hypothetical protein
MTSFHEFAKTIVARHEEHLCDYGPDEQIARAVEALEKFAVHTPLRPADPGHMIDLAGFGSAPVHFYGPQDKYLLISEVGAALGMPIWETTRWARQQHLYAVEDQREADEERGDGRLGYECMRDYLDLRLWAVAENPEAKPDAGGRRHSDYGDWLISHDRLMLLILDSPWSKEFQANMRDLMFHGAKRFLGGLFDEVPVIDMSDGSARTASPDDLFHSPLTEEEARLKARRGPNIPPGELEEP